MTHVICRLTAKNRDRLRNPIRSVIEYGLPLPFYAYCDTSTTVVISESLLELLMALACTMMYM